MARVYRFGELGLKEKVQNFIEEKLKKDELSYEGHIKTKYNPGSPWNPSSWIVDEILNFFEHNFSTSYVLKEFIPKYQFGVISDILEVSYPKEFDEAEKIWYERNE